MTGKRKNSLFVSAEAGEGLVKCARRSPVTEIGGGGASHSKNVSVSFLVDRDDDSFDLKLQVSSQWFQC